MKNILTRKEVTGQVGVLGAVLSFVVVAIAIVISIESKVGVRVFSDVEQTIDISDTKANSTATDVIKGVWI